MRSKSRKISSDRILSRGLVDTCNGVFRTRHANRTRGALVDPAYVHKYNCYCYR